MFRIKITDVKIIPYVRMTQKGKFIKQRATKYLKNQEQLSWLFKICGKGKVDAYPIRLKGKLILKNFRSNADWDNYIKAIQDAMVKAGILPDDSLKYIQGADFVVEKGDRNELDLVLYSTNKSTTHPSRSGSPLPEGG